MNDIYTVKFGYLQMNEIMRIIKDSDLVILQQQFDNDCSIQLSIRKMQVNEVLGKLQKLDGVTAKYDHSI